MNKFCCLTELQLIHGEFDAGAFLQYLSGLQKFSDNRCFDYYGINIDRYNIESLCLASAESLTHITIWTDNFDSFKSENI